MSNTAKLIFATVIVVTVAVMGILYLLLGGNEQLEPVAFEEPVEEVISEPETFKTESVIGQSVEGRDIVAVTFGNGDRHLLFVGGIHGGYEWNSTLLAYEFINYFNNNQRQVPEDLTITIIPTLNPDGLYESTGVVGEFSMTDVPDPETRVAAGRFNANEVDLNRNFACKWAPESTWRGEVVSAGDYAFSEPEAIALRDFVEKNPPEAVVFWHSKANNVYASECENGVLPKTLEVMQTYADAAGYGAVPVFDAYPITGDAEGWLASIGIPAVTVELETHDSIEWSKNMAGVTALLDMYSIAK